MEREGEYKLIDELLAEVPGVKIPDDLHFNAALIMKLAEEERGVQRREIRISKVVRRRRMLAGLCASFLVLAGVAYFGLNNLRMGGAMKSAAPAEAVDSVGKAELDQPRYTVESTPLSSEDRNQPDSVVYGLGEYELQRMQSDMDEHPDWYEILWEALEDGNFAQEFAEADLGYGFYICELTDTAEGIEFMVYFYTEADTDEFDCTNSDSADIRSILWKKK